MPSQDPFNPLREKEKATAEMQFVVSTVPAPKSEADMVVEERCHWHTEP
jgi:hypothetical protein